MSAAIHYATGRRKTSSARVYLSKGKGKILVNNKELAHYFGRQVAQMLVMQPLKLTELDEQVDIKAMVKVEEALVKLEQLDMVFLEPY
jgi:small subunit ribosomal protein S9